MRMASPICGSSIIPSQALFSYLVLIKNTKYVLPQIARMTAVYVCDRTLDQHAQQLQRNADFVNSIKLLIFDA